MTAAQPKTLGEIVAASLGRAHQTGQQGVTRLMLRLMRERYPATYALLTGDELGHWTWTYRVWNGWRRDC